ncbi:MAG: outer membrane beta-barrel protein [Pseudomonadota bacterium]|uniref:outer membrane beta-barrel protein n=1 Tax=Sphingobium sp. CECT 9361 TaxID=2845384 RepID=UPI001E3B986D|nr:outer membrane beta-barrel protein [Sphingobium sp. CECT 9361]CAH0356469.1 hypothetical protein SPH9361_04111 [Sphingobium sp. CECT 9361]
MKRYVLLGCSAIAAMAGVPQVARAQLIGEQLLDTALPLTYDRGRNVSVIDRQRPEYEPVGINLGGFTLLPAVEARVGHTNNVYQTQNGEISDGYITLAPRATVRSNWSVHSLRLDAGARLLRYFKEGDRNENGWYVGGAGTYDISGDASVSLSARTARQFETRFSSVANPDVRQANPFQSTNARILGKLILARSKILAAATYSRLDYKSVDLFSGGTLDQNNRDRDVYRGTLHYEYGLTPDTSLLAEVSYTRTNYDLPLTAVIPNRDSDEWNALGGVSFDLSALVRGSIAAGYVRRSFDAIDYKTVSGVSAAARIEYFPTELTTVTLAARREIEDANVFGSSAYFANSGAVRVDHELLRNLIVNIAGEYEVDNYFAVPGRVKIFRATGGAKFALNNMISLTGDVRYAKRTSSVPTIGADISERRATIGVIFQR